MGFILSDNKIEELPQQACDYKGTLRLFGNPLSEYPPSTHNDPRGLIRSIRDGVGKSNLTSMRVLIIGPAEAGKTSLIINWGFDCEGGDPTCSSTVAIDVKNINKLLEFNGVIYQVSLCEYTTYSLVFSFCVFLCVYVFITHFQLLEYELL